MNGTEQRHHTTVVSALTAKVDSTIEAFDAALDELKMQLAAEWKVAIENEQKTRARLLTEARIATELVADHGAEARAMLSARIGAFESLTFWDRMRWLLTGRLR